MHIRNKRLAISVSAASFLLAVSGCSTPLTKESTKGFTDAEKKVDELKNPSTMGSWLKETSTPYLLGQKISAEAQPLPGVFNETVTLKIDKPTNLTEVANYLTEASGQLIRTLPDALTVAAGQSAPAGAASGGSTPSTTPTAAPAGGSSVAGSGAGLIRINYTGSLQSILNLIAVKSGTYWRYNETQKTVEIYGLETVVFHIPVMPGTATQSGGVGTGIGGGSSGGASSEGASGGGGTTASTSQSVHLWDDIKSAISVVSNSAKISVDTSLGLVTVTGTPDEITKIRRVVRQITKDVTKQIELDVDVYQVSLDKEDNYGLNMAAAFTNLKNQFSLSNTSVSTPAFMWTTATSGSYGATIVKPSGKVTTPLGAWGGSQLAYQALSTLGHVVLQTHTTALTTNGQIIPMQVATQTGYLASSTTTLAATGGLAQQTNTPGQVTTGFTTVMIPHAVGDEIYIGMNMTLNNLNSITAVGNPALNQIQVPNVSSTKFEQVAHLHSGESVVLTGYKQIGTQDTSNGVFRPSFFGLGGGADVYKKKHEMAIVISARIIN